MSSPPPGYSEESMLQGGTAPILSVMGGGRVMAAMKKLRKKRSRKQNRKRATRGTKKARRKPVEQEGGNNHYSLVAKEQYKENKAHTLHIARISMEPVPIKQYKDGTQSFTSLITYLEEKNKQWVRKIALLMPNFHGKISNIPTIDNIGVSSGLGQATLKIVRYTPDRLCRVLHRDTSAIVVLPAVQGELQMFERIASAVRNDLIVRRSDRYRVYIFSPPFFGLIPETNFVLYSLFLMYKTTLILPTWEMYLLPEYSTENIQATTAVSKAILNNKEAKGVLDALTLPLTDETKYAYASTRMKTSLFPMLEPTYIIYPYTISIEQSTAGPTDSALTEYTARVQASDNRIKELQTKFNEAASKADAAEKLLAKQKTDAWDALQQANTSRSNYAELDAKYTALNSELAGATLQRDAAKSNTGSPDYAAKVAAVTVLEGKIGVAKAALEQALAKSEADVAAYNAVNQTASEQANSIPALKGVATKAEHAVEKATSEKEKLGPKPSESPQAIKQGRGGMLFSAATPTEPTLPAAYSGFKSPIQYVQTNDANTARRSIAYRSDTSKREPTLDTMDYKEYRLLTAPPMTSKDMYIINLKQGELTGAIQMDETMNVFTGSPNAVQTHVPTVNISVGAIDYSIRSPVPDVVNDWNNGIFSSDEAAYLNAMQFTPRILQDEKVFGTAWKVELSNHLSMISRSSCFKDSRLLLHADCQDAQRFVSKVLEYYMNNSEYIIRRKQQEGDDLALTLQKQLEAQIADRGTQNAVGDSIFSPDAFVKGFFPPKGTMKGTIPNEFITSVSPIMLDKTLQKLDVGYGDDEKPNAAEKAKIEQLVNDTFTITPSGDSKYVWEFTRPHGLSEIISQARLFIPSFKCTNPYSEQRIPIREIRVVYRGELSEIDKKRVEKALGSTFAEKGEIINTHVFTFTEEIALSPQEIMNRLTNINNTNKRIFALTPDNSPDAKLTDLMPNLDIKTNRITKTFLASMGVSSPGKKIQYVNLSMAFDTGISHAESYKQFDLEYKRMATMINARQGDAEYDPNFIFKDRYIFQA